MKLIRHNIEIVGMQTDNAAIASLAFRAPGGSSFYASGTSKRAPGDTRNPVIGAGLAVVRALQDASAQLVAGLHQEAGGHLEGADPAAERIQALELQVEVLRRAIRAFTDETQVLPLPLPRGRTAFIAGTREMAHAVLGLLGALEFEG